MSLNVISLVVDLYDSAGTGNAVTIGSATFTPSSVLTDVPDQMLRMISPVTVQFKPPSGLPSVSLLATDNAAPAPSGWAWAVTFNVEGTIPGYSVFVPAGPASFTATQASPAVFTWTPTAALTSLPNGTGVQLSGGTLPGGFNAGTTYYVVASSGTTFELAATSSGSPLASSSAGSGQLAVVQYHLSALSPVSSVTTMAAFMPLPSGTPSARQLPFATGSGEGAAWGTLQSGDLPAATTSAQGAVELDGTASDIQPAGTSASAGSTGKAADAGHVHAALGRLLNDRGAIAASTAYNPGDMVAYRGQRVLITTATTSSAWSPWFTPPALPAGTYIPITSEAVYYAADWGVVMDGTTDNGPALNRALQFMFDSQAGGFLMLPGGSDPAGVVCGVSSTVIIPPNCFIVGGGIQTSSIRLNAGANCDVIQFQTFLSSSQAAIITAATGVSITVGSLRNAFYSGLMHLTVDGNQGNQGTSQYNYGINITTNPLTSQTGTDPGFDPTNLLMNVEVRGCTGDGLYHNGRGQLRVTDCVFRANNGNGAVPSFDVLFTGCNFGGNGLGGIYVNYASCNGAANKSYNNGAIAQWASGSNYTAGRCVMYGGAMYRAISALTNDTTPPSSDSAHWAALTANAPQAWGTGFYFDTNASEDTWTGCDSQENAASDYYLHGCLSVSVQGVCANTAFLAASNPNYYSSLVLDGATGCLADISFARLNSIAYALRAVNGATRNDVRMTGDTTYAAVLSPDTASLVGSGNAVRVNGAMLSDSVAPVFTPTGLTGATAASRYVGATTSGAPASGTFTVGDYSVDRTGALWVCTTAGSPGTWTQVGGASAAYYAPTGLTGATAASRYVGATNGGAPASGTFAVGDFAVDRTGAFWICTTAGTVGSGCVFTEVFPGTGLTNPMTAAGDTIYGGSSGTPARLPGSTSIQKMFLSQTGTGSASAAPAWSAQEYSGLFGDGSDGAVTLNGTNTYSGFSSLAGSTYTLTRDVFASSLTVSSGVTLVTAGYLIFCMGTVTNSGTIGVNGNNASGATRGIQTAPGTLGPGEQGGAGTSGNGAQGAAAVASLGVGSGGASGAGSSGTAASQLNPTISTAWPFRKPSCVLAGWTSSAHGNAVSVPAGGCGGGSGGGDGTNSGGGGGGGGPIIVILAWSVINNGTITAAGGNGGTPPAGNCGGGGGGGGNIIIYTLSAWTAGTTNVAGGTGGSGAGTGAAGSAGGPGSVLNVLVQ